MGFDFSCRPKNLCLKGCFWGGLIAMAFLCFPCTASAGNNSAAGKYYVSLYGAKNSPDRFLEILTRMSPEFRSSYLVALTGGYRITTWRWIRFEVEGQAVVHTGMQEHLEVNGVAIARWMNFPWDQWLDTRIAFGEGISYAFRKPHLEPRRDPGAATSKRLLNYLLAEIELVRPCLPQWSTFIRVHHRSGMFGMYGGVEGGSNFIGAGIRYYF
jgi:hypothetical protein